jgi:hypothetical protein
MNLRLNFIPIIHLKGKQNSEHYEKYFSECVRQVLPESVSSQ